MFAPPDLLRLPDPVTQAEFYSGTVAKRAFSWVIDVLIVGLMTGVVAVLTLGVGFFFLPVIYVVISFLYRVVTLAGGSATLGMRVMNIEFLTRNGERFDLSHALLHTIGYTLSIGTMLVQLLSIALMMMSARGQGLTDHVLGTVVINRA
ncbi:RDD family protein [Gemmobacter serpentinus]|uniref:RDD family protein n=1 Tax=Gemmobacter serpentinus TaxID=2652247 RepID=UPI0018658159|nr:RDD family protein [Gemmobacter serpentinus]